MARSDILITASTGNVGLPLSKALYSKHITFTAATRDSKNAKKKMGFETEFVNLDFEKPSTFGPALENKKILFLCGPSATPGAEDMLMPLIKEAKNKGIRFVVFIASYSKIMDFIEKNDMDHTFIKANFFMQNFEMYQTEDIRDKDQIFMPTGNGKAPFIHCRDIGEVAAEIIEDPDKFKQETIYITGPEAMDHYKAADIFSEVLDRKIKYRDPDDDTYRKVMKERGFSDRYIDAMIAVFGKIKKGEVEKTSEKVSEILNREPISLKEYVEDRKGYFSP